MKTKHYIFALHAAFINMGYRPMNPEQSIFGKPIGFGIIIAEAKGDNIEFKTMFNDANGDAQIWDSSIMNVDEIACDLEGEELYNKFTYNIAYKEFEAKAEKMFFPICGGNNKTFAFR